MALTSLNDGICINRMSFVAPISVSWTVANVSFSRVADPLLP
jgi:hypothetical protein